MRLPLGATLVTLFAVPLLLALGAWQLQRAQWKADLIAEAGRARTLPPVAPREWFRAMVGELSVQFRRAVVDCRPGRVKPYDLRGGQSAAGQGGYTVLVNCGDQRRAPDLVLAVGWADRPGTAPLLVDATFTGTVVERPYGDAPNRPRFLVIADKPVPPLAPTRQPDPADLPNNHFSYALQWFAFAATLGVIYLVYARGWRRRIFTSRRSQHDR